MEQTEKYALAIRLLKELNCPDALMAALEVWGWLVRADEIKLHNWQALNRGGVVEGEAREVEVFPEIQAKGD